MHLLLKAANSNGNLYTKPDHWSIQFSIAYTGWQ